MVHFLNNRSLDLDMAFHQPQESNHMESYNKIMRSLGYSLDKQVKTWWDIISLERYLKEGIIVRRLRWDVAPQDALNYQESKEELLNVIIGWVRNSRN